MEIDVSRAAEHINVQQQNPLGINFYWRQLSLLAQ